MEPIDGLILHHRVPPRVDKENVVGHGEVESYTGNLQAAQDHLHMVVTAKRLQRLHSLSVRHGAVEAYKWYFSALQLPLCEIQ